MTTATLTRKIFTREDSLSFRCLVYYHHVKTWQHADKLSAGEGTENVQESTFKSKDDWKSTEILGMT